MRFQKNVLSKVISEDVSSTRFRKTKLRNGLTVLFEKRDVDVTTVMIGVRYGSGYDSIKEKGMAHFIEHLCFKGTRKRSAMEITSEVEKIGGEINAFTSEEFTAYHVKLPSRHLGVAMDVMFDIFFNPIFPDDDVKRESFVICEEIKMYKDSPMRHSLEVLEENLYNEPFGVSGTGKEEVVKAMTKEKLLTRHDEIYIPKNTILCVVGNNDFKEVVQMAEELSKDKNNNDVRLKFPDVVLRNIDSEEKRDVEQSNVVLGVHFPKGDDNMNYAAEVFSTILGRGMSSKLFTEIREKRGLVYGVKSYLDSGKHFGYLVIWAGTNPSKVDEVKKICLEEFGRMKDLTQKELDEAKIQVVGNRKVEAEGSSETAINLISAEIVGNAEEYYDYENNINKVTLEDIKELANKSEFASFVLGP